MLLIISAMEQELSRVRKALQNRKLTSEVRESIETHVIGIGRRNTQYRTNTLLEANMDLTKDNTGPPSLLLLGFAGAVDTSLRTGDMVLANCYYQTNNDCAEPDPTMQQHGQAVATQIEARVTDLASLTVDRIVTNPANKATLRNQYLVSTVNMEDYWVAQVAAHHGVPFLSARTVLDTANQILPEYLLELSGSRGQAIGVALTSPWRVPTMLKVGRHMRAAQRTLSDFAITYINHRRLAAYSEPPSMQ